MTETDRLIEAQKLGDGLVNKQLVIKDVIDRVLEKSGGTDHFLIVADQFEELFTQAPQISRRTFVEELLETTGDTKVSVMLVFRADFYNHMISLSRPLCDALERNVVNLGPMTHEEITCAIARPAQHAGLQLEKGLVERIASDVIAQPGSLPLLEFALTELWKGRHDILLTHETYGKSGGVAGAIAERAETEFGRLPLELQLIAQRVFTQLVRVARPEEGAKDTRQCVELDALGAEAEEVIRFMADARLVVTGHEETTGARIAEMAHEALIQAWERLQAWVNADRQFLLWRQRLRGAIAEWKYTKRSDDALLVKALLPEALDWMKQRRDELNSEERGFIESSCRLHEHEEYLLEDLRERAEAPRQAVLARWLARQADELRRSNRPDLLSVSVLLSVEAIKRHSCVEADQALRKGLDKLPRLGASGAGPNPNGIFTDGEVARVTDAGPWPTIVFSSDGEFLLTAGSDKNPTDYIGRVWQCATGREVVRIPEQNAGYAFAFSPDGRHLATGSSDKTWVLEVSTARQVACMVHEEGLINVAFSPDGQFLVTRIGNKLKLPAARAQLWEAITGQEITHLTAEKPLSRITFSSDGKLIATINEKGTFRVCEVASGREIAGISGGSGLEFSLE